MKFYLDSNVFLARLLKEFGKITDYMEGAFEEFINFCAENNHTMVISDLFFKEVIPLGYISKEEIISYIKQIKEVNLEETSTSENDLEIAEQIKIKTKIHYSDSTHIQLALKTNCDYIITWNKKDFDKAKDIIPCATPREII